MWAVSAVPLRGCPGLTPLCGCDQSFLDRRVGQDRAAIAGPPSVNASDNRSPVAGYGVGGPSPAQGGLVPPYKLVNTLTTKPWATNHAARHRWAAMPEPVAVADESLVNARVIPVPRPPKEKGREYDEGDDFRDRLIGGLHPANDRRPCPAPHSDDCREDEQRAQAELRAGHFYRYAL
jgi:hypothetical protein